MLRAAVPLADQARYLVLFMKGSGSIGQILEPLDTLGHRRMRAEETCNASGGKGIDDIHLCLGRIHVHRKAVVAVFELEQRIGEG
jgi:hypothetical protein